MSTDIDNLFSYREAGKAAGDARFLVVLLHGYGRNGHVMEKQAEQILRLVPEARIVMPHGPDTLEKMLDDAGNALPVPQVLRSDEAQAILGDRRQWFSIRGKRSDLAAGLIRTARNLNLFIDRHQGQAGVDSTHTALMGFSQGGGLALYTALTRPAPLACVVGHSTIFLTDAPAVSQTPALYLYGTQDEEFDLPVFHDGAARLGQQVHDLTINSVVGLGHRTSEQSRAIVARYIAGRLRRAL